MLSLRSRILLVVMLLIGLVTAVVNWSSYRDAHHEIQEIFDAQLVNAARLLQGTLGRPLNEADWRELQVALDRGIEARGNNRLGHPYELKQTFQAFDSDGRMRLASAGTGEGFLNAIFARQGIRPQPGTPLAAYPVAGFHDLVVAGREWRVFLLPAVGDGYWILCAERADVRGDLVGQIAGQLLLPEVVGLFLLALVWPAVSWGLRPLQRMVELIKMRDPGNLAPLVLPRLPRELEPMAGALNRLLLQLNGLITHEKRFIANAAHELRTPLAVLRINAQNALEAESPADRADALRHLLNGVDRATRILTQLLTLARLEPDALELVRQDFNALAFIRSELAELAPLALQRGQELTLEADERQTCRFFGDAPSLGILLQNLVSNAIQYTPMGGRVTVGLDCSPDCLTLRVADNGPGVTQEQMSRLFERFYRVGQGDGSGLGLSIVQRIAEMHSGRVRLEYNPGGGLVVVVELPRAAANGAEPDRRAGVLASPVLA